MVFRFIHNLIAGASRGRTGATHTSSLIPHNLRRRNGQSLILAIVIMFLLAFLAVIFIAMVTRNLFQAGRSNDVLRAEQLAHAGIEYADAQLTRSEDGADWRPAPTPDTALVANDPDHKWINDLAISQRFTRVNSGQGRFLLRVSYNPDPLDPMSKYIKIESIGRLGSVDPADPTTLTTAGEQALRVEMTAYKPIGVTDYVRFVTNKDKRSTPVSLDAPGYDVTFGSPYVSAAEPGNGAPIRVNGSLLWQGGKVQIFLRGTTTAGGNDMPIDTVAVSGDIFHALPSPGAPVTAIPDVTVGRILYTGINASDGGGGQVLPSADPLFNTYGGYYRDGSDALDRGGQPRAIRRIEPPLLDVFERSARLTRYRALTRNSGEWMNVGTAASPNWLNTGWFGWGRGVYIDNGTDIQEESGTLTGGFTLRGDWTKPNNVMSNSRWRGPYYIAEGVQITLNPVDTDGTANGDDGETPDITLTRTDKASDGSKRVWLNSVGVPQVGLGQTITMHYPKNGVIYAEGNVRIKGMLPPGVQLTVVSGGTIYIEGNILKYRNHGDIDPDPRCAIALLAEDYICVNTTQFVSFLAETSPMSMGSDSQNREPPYHFIISPEPESNFRSVFSFGPAQYLKNFQPFVCVRHSGQYGSAYVNMWVNRGDDPSMGDGLYNFADFTDHTMNINWPSTWPGWVYGYADVNAGGTFGSDFEHRTWSLDVDTVGTLNPIGLITPAVGYPNYLQLGLDQSTWGRNNYLLSCFAIQPLDVVIEAILYAQNKSFFVIPGQWFNPNPDDTPEQYALRNNNRPLGTDPKFPFFGQSLDIKITINGAVTENLPAPVGDVDNWMAKWSNIPSVYGSTTEPSRHPGEGLTYLYDPLIGYPWAPAYGGIPAHFIRVDSYGRPLPAAPKLPVSPTLVYYGDAV